VLPAEMTAQVMTAGVLLAFMSIVDTLAYGVRTAGVMTRRLAISLSLFNALVIFSRLSNVVQAPVLGNMPDKVSRGVYTASDVLTGLRIDLLFVVGGVILGALFTPTFIKISCRGIAVMEAKGRLPQTVLHGMRRLAMLPHYLSFPSLGVVRRYVSLEGIPRDILIVNVFVTCFYTIGVMSTLLAASWDHNVAGTAIMLSGIVNGIATILLFILVDPPAAVVIDQCISGKRPAKDAKTLNMYLVLSRLAGCILAIAALPLLGRYVLAAAHWVDGIF
jgi:hypothetical protein